MSGQEREIFRLLTLVTREASEEAILEGEMRSARGALCTGKPL